MKEKLNLLLLLIVLTLVTPTSVSALQANEDETQTYGTTYYLDSSISKNYGNGLSPDNAFDSLDDINERFFQPGDKILIKANSSFKGTLWPKGSGCAGYPIIIDMYGSGEKPIIDADGAYFMEQKKDWKGPFTGISGNQIGAAVYLYNQEYVEINNLSVKNQGDNINRDRSGIRVEGYDYGVINHIYIRNCHVQDVRGYNGQDDIYPVIPTNDDGSPLDGYVGGDQSKPNTSNTFWGARTTHRTGGINLVTYTARHKEAKNQYNVDVQELDESKKITTFNNVLIENNTIENCQANGITTTNVKGTLDDVKFRHTQVVIRDNSIHNVTRAGIVPLYTDKVLVEYNKVDKFQSTYEGYGCGIWCDRANGMTFQYNEVCNGQNGQDGMAFNLDDMTHDGVIQYNYTHDNYGGGYMLHVRQKSYNKNNIIRYNLSINDSGIFADHNAQVVAVGESDVTKLENAKVYNNTFISDKDCHAVYRGDDVYYNNNIWYFKNASVATRNNCFEPGANSKFNNNAYVGCIAPTDEKAYSDDPKFYGGTDLFKLDRNQAYIAANLKTTSPYLSAGISILNSGGHDIIGNVVSDKINLGAFGGAGHDNEVVVSQTIEKGDVKRYLSDDTQQTNVIEETTEAANEKWVDTTFLNKGVVYTKKKGNYVEFSFVGTGGKLKIKRGAGAGKLLISVYKKNDLSQTVKELEVNSYNANAELKEISDLIGLSSDNQEYVVIIKNNENGKAVNFVEFTSDVTTTTGEQGCKNDHLSSVILDQPMQMTIPYEINSVSTKLNARVFMDTCSPADNDVKISYSVDNEAIVEGNVLTITKPGTYNIIAVAQYKQTKVTDQKTISIKMGLKPQVNVSTLNTKALTNLVNECNNIDYSNYTDVNKNEFKETLGKAKDLLDSKNVTQIEIDAMFTKLKTAKDGLQQIHFNAEEDKIIKSGNWVMLEENTLDQGKALKSGVKDEKMCLTFNGNKITVFGRKAVGTCTAKITVYKIRDDGSESIVDTKGVDCYQINKADKQSLYQWSTQENGVYRIEIMNTGIKNTSATNRDTNIIIDYLQVGYNKPVELNEKALTDLINKYKDLKLDHYIDGIEKENFKKELKNAQGVLTTAKTQSDLDGAVSALESAYQKLNIKDLTKVEAESEDVERIGNQDNWATISGDNIFSSAIKTDLKGNKAVYNFIGDGIEVIGRKAVGTGIVKFIVYQIIDGEATVKNTKLVDTYQARLADGEILYSYFGELGTYRIECENTGEFNPNSNGSNNMIIDYFNVFNKKVETVNKDELIALVKRIEEEKLNSDNYTKDSFIQLNDALLQAKDVINNDNTQEVVNDAYKVLNEKRMALIEVHKVTFKKADGTSQLINIENNSNFVSSKLSMPKDSQTGYEFIGWIIENTSNVFTKTTPVTKSIAVTPAFKPIVYTVKLHDNDQVIEHEYTIEDKLDLEVLEKDGCKFLGWFDNKEGQGNPIDSIDVGTIDNKDYYAKWEVVSKPNEEPTEPTEPVQPVKPLNPIKPITPSEPIVPIIKDSHNEAVKTGDMSSLIMLPVMTLSLVGVGLFIRKKRD